MIGVFAVKQKLAFLINTSRDKYSKFRCVHAISSNSLTLKVKKILQEFTAIFNLDWKWYFNSKTKW